MVSQNQIAVSYTYNFRIQFTNSILNLRINLVLPNFIFSLNEFKVYLSIIKAYRNQHDYIFSQ